MARFDLNAAFFGGPGYTLYHAWGSNSAMPLTPHFHDEYLICAQIRGEEECEVSGKAQEFQPGDVVLINPQQVHTGNARGADALEYISLYVDREVVANLARELGAPTTSPEFTVVKASSQWNLVEKLRHLLSLSASLDANQLYPSEHTPTEDDVELPRKLAPDTVVESPAQADERLEIESALHDVITHAFKEFSNLRQPMLRSTNRVGHRKIAKAIEHIRALDPGHNPASISLEELAGIAGLSKYHFLRQFNSVVGMTPGAYLRTLRLCHAARKLRTTDMPILDVALSVGFADHPSFSRAFARHMGMTPSEYQKLGPLL